jgi:Tfp pilus assembly protein PilF
MAPVRRFEPIPLGAELPKLFLLILIVIATFFLARQVAAVQRHARVEESVALAAQGQSALTAGHIDDAITAFRRAVVRNRDERQYAIALGDALSRAGQLTAARDTLLAVRERTPDDPEVNLQLARIAARQGEVDTANRYYRNALYAPWPDDARALEARLELSTFLLDSGRPAQAAAELTMAADDPAATASTLVRTSELLLRANSLEQAFAGFRAALDKAPADAAALAGAGTAAFRLRQYAVAKRYLDAVPDDTSVADMRALAGRVVAADPLAPRLGAGERRRRATANLMLVAGRLESCRAGLSEPTATSALDAALATTHRATAAMHDVARDAVEDSLSAIAAAEQAIGRFCGPPTLDDRTFGLIVGLHAEAP